MKFPRPKNYRYLAGVAEYMNDEFKLEGSKDRAVVMNIDGKLKIVILKEVIQ